MKCPICGEEDNSKPFKHWVYVGYNVGRHRCANCGEPYNAYESDGKIKFTVPRTPR